MYGSRSVAMSIILCVVTCGLYSFFWLVSMANEVNIASGRPYATSGGMVLLLTIVTCGIYGLYWLYKTGEALDNVRRNHREPTGSLAILYLLLGAIGLGLVSYALIQSELNKYAQDAIGY